MPSLYTIKHTSVPYYKYFILTIYNFFPTNMLHVGDLHFVSINGGKWCPHSHTSPTVKRTPAKESKVHNGGGPYPRPDLRISRSLHHGGTGKPGSDMRFNVHNGEGPYSHPDVVSPAFLGAPYPQETALSVTQFGHKGFA